jgi:peptide/nickel transport system ATP-binding protein
MHYPGGGLFRKGPVVRAVDGVTFEVGRGETLGLVGESGCGKSSVGRTILRLQEPTAGSAKFDGQDVFGLDKKNLRNLRKRMQIVFQDPYSSLDPRMTVGDSIAEGLEIHSLVPKAGIPDRVAALLDEVGLDRSYAERYPHEFSGGQRQRVGIARALAVEPSFIVCDEPVSALDVSVQAQVINLLMDLQARRGLSYLFIAHDLAVVRQIAHRIAVMYLGRIVETGEVEKVLTAPRHPYTQALLSVLPEAPGDPVVLTGEPPDPSRIPAGCRFHARCQILASGEAERAGVADACRGEDLEVLNGSGEAQVACHWARLDT